MSKDTMEVLVQVQNVALDPATTEETLRNMLIDTLEVVEKDQRLIASMKRLQALNEKMIGQQDRLIEELQSMVGVLTS